MGTLPTAWIFLPYIKMLPAQICFLFSPKPLCLIFLVCNLQFAELKLILIFHANTTFQPLFLFFARDFEFNISKPQKIFFLPQRLLIQQGIFFFLKGKAISRARSPKDDLFFLSLRSFVILCISLSLRGSLLPFLFIYCLLG